MLCVLRLDPMVAGKRATKGMLGQLTKSTVMVNCMCGGLRHAQTAGKILFPGPSVRVFPEGISI